jgi:hypothetical protein
MEERLAGRFGIGELEDRVRAVKGRTAHQCADSLLALF